MSTPVEAPPAPVREPEFKPTEITLGEITRLEPPVPVTPPAVDPPVVPPVAPPVEQPKAGPGPLDNLFGPPATPATPVADPPAPTDPPAGDTPSKLRDALATQKAQYETQIAEADRQRLEYQQRIEEAERKMESWRQEQSLIDPSVAPEVVEISSQLDSQIKAAARQLSPKAAREFLTSGKDMIEKYSGLGEVYDQGYDQRHAALRMDLQKTYGADADDVFRSLPGLAETVDELKNRVSRVANGSADIIQSRMEAVHLDAVRQLDGTYAETLSFNEELARANPFATQNVIARLTEASPEFKAQSENIKNFLKQSIIPPRPLSKAALASMTPEQRNKSQQDHAKSYQDSYAEVHKAIPLALHAMAALPTMAQMLSDKNKEIADLKAMLPPGESRFSPPPASTPPSTSPINGVRPIDMSEIAR